MAKGSKAGSSGRKHQWFARRQVYLRSGRDSQYVELSPALQIGVALGFGVLALWLIGTSYSALTGVADAEEQAATLARLGLTEQALDDAVRERDALLEKTAQMIDLEAALAEAEAAAAGAANPDEVQALSAELEQSQAQIGELQLRLSESKTEQATLQAKLEAEASATADHSEKTAEEAAGLHTQLENAFAEIQTLQQEKQTTNVEMQALNEEKTAKDETIERNAALLKAATAEIERLQETLTLADSEAEEKAQERQAAIDKLEAELNDALAVRGDLEQQSADLRTQLDEALAVVSTLEEQGSNAAADAQAAMDAAVQEVTAGAEERETGLRSTIDGLRAELAVKEETLAAAKIEDESSEESEELAALRQRVSLAEAEVERLILSGLRTNDVPTATPASLSDGGDENLEDDDPAETERLRSELLTAQADIIKLNADVKAAKQRLADKSATQDGQAAKPDNSAKLEQQLASSRSRVQQLNKALADAKLREVAIDLALINVVPTPSPPAPR